MPVKALETLSVKRNEPPSKLNVAGRPLPRKVKLCSAAYRRIASRRAAALCRSQKKMQIATTMQIAITMISVVTPRLR